MAEGGTESLRNNLCWNQNEKKMEEKDIHEMSAFPELRIFSPSQSFNCLAALDQRQLPAAHCHSRCSTTELKKPLNEAPALTPITSMERSEERDPESGQRALDESRPSSSVGITTSAFNPTPSPGEGIAGEQSPTSSLQQVNQAPEAASMDIASSYLRCTISSSTQDTVSMPASQQPSASPNKASTNDLSASKAMPPQPLHHYSGMMGPGVPGLPPPGMMFCPLPVGYVHNGHSLLMPLSTYNGMGGHSAFGGMSLPIPAQMMQNTVPVHMMQNIFPAQMMQNISCRQPAAEGGQGGCSLTMTCGNTNQPTLDSRNIPANQQGHFPPSSDENISGSTQSYSINPGDNTRLVRLRKPILDWLRKKLDNPSHANWEALADAHGWKYDDIRAHLTECRHTRESPFLKLLETEEFCTYTVKEFLKDMKEIKRLDIFMDFDSVIQNNRS